MLVFQELTIYCYLSKNYFTQKFLCNKIYFENIKSFTLIFFITVAFFHTSFNIHYYFKDSYKFVKTTRVCFDVIILTKPYSFNGKLPVVFEKYFYSSQLKNQCPN